STLFPYTTLFRSVGSPARLRVVGDRDDHQLVHAIRIGQRAQALAHLGGGAGDRASARLLDDAELARRVRVRLGLLDRWVRARAARVESHDEQVPAPREAERLGLGVGAHDEDGDARARRGEERGRPERRRVPARDGGAALVVDEVREGERGAELRRDGGSHVAGAEQAILGHGWYAMLLDTRDTLVPYVDTRTCTLIA